MSSSNSVPVPSSAPVVQAEPHAEEKKKLTSFRELTAWQEGHELAKEVYGVTQTFPKEETFGLANMMRRAALMVTSKIAEGFGRGSFRDKAVSYSYSRGALSELHNQVIMSHDLGFVDDTLYGAMISQVEKVSRILGALLAKTKNIAATQAVSPAAA